MTDYDTYFQKFYTEKLSFLSMKQKYMKCEGCNELKKFIENDNELTFSCGDKQGKCGTQFSIQLPQYINYNQRKQLLQEEIHGSIQDYNPDINDLSYHNHKLIKTMYPHSKLQSTSTLRDIDKDSYKKQLTELNKKYESQNNIKDIYKQGIDYHKERMLHLSQQKKLLIQIKDETLSDQEKQEVLIKYLALSKQNQEDYKQLYEKVHSPINPYIEEEKAIIQKITTTHSKHSTDLKKPSKKPSKKPTKKKEDKQYKKGDKVLFESSKGEKKGIIDKVMTTKLTIIDDITNNKFMIPYSKVLELL
jgi:hypothetical protein